MRKLLLASGLIAAMAVPTLASAYTTRCERDQASDRAGGTVAGGLLGALAGSAIAGRGDRTEGAIIGGVVGAVAGNQLSKSKPCPTGYISRQYDDRYDTRRARYACRWEDRPYRDAYGHYVPNQVQVCR